jgi:hypothetical protein
MRTRWIAAACAAALALGVSREADACGGTFCDAGPTAMPVAQTGETILFVLDDDAVEAHIQIQYDPETEADRFAWVIPVMALPEFSVGSQPLFERMLAQTAPTYGSSSWREPCSDSDGGDGACSDSNADGESSDGEFKLDLGGGSGPEVVERRTVGAFEVTVLQGGTADEVAQWLVDNDYQTDDAATPILGDYLAKGFLFVAVKLATDAEAADVHPIVLRVPGNEPCVPITLTRIAAQDDLRLRVLFLADARVVPDNYAHVVLNDVRLDWITQASNYDAIVTKAVDGAGGRAWITEYAGAADVVSLLDLAGADWQAPVFAELDAAGAIDQVLAQGMRECGDAFCRYTHPLVEGLLREFLHPPVDADVEAFYACPSCDPEVLAAATFDDVLFAMALRDRVILPARHGQALFERFPVITRMYTTLSPEEMLLDPTFIENADADTQSRLEHMGRAASWCDGTRMFQLPDTRVVAIADPTTWPAFPDMPAYDRVEQWGPAGAPIVVEDRRHEIDEALATWNMANGGARVPPLASCHDSDGWIDSFASDAVEPPPRAEASGCACRSIAPAPSGLVLLVVLGLRRRNGSPRPSRPGTKTLR